MYMHPRSFTIGKSEGFGSIGVLAVLFISCAFESYFGLTLLDLRNLLY